MSARIKRAEDVRAYRAQLAATMLRDAEDAGERDALIQVRGAGGGCSVVRGWQLQRGVWAADAARCVGSRRSGWAAAAARGGTFAQGWQEWWRTFWGPLHSMCGVGWGGLQVWGTWRALAKQDANSAGSPPPCAAVRPPPAPHHRCRW